MHTPLAGIIPGTTIYKTTKFQDERGFFLRVFDFSLLNETPFCQVSISESNSVHTLRGFHFDTRMLEWKLVSCIKGSIFDATVDLRSNEKSFLLKQSLTLDSRKGEILLIPPGVAHAFLTLESDTVVAYAMSIPFNSDYYSGLVWNDPTLDFVWPYQPKIISARDKKLPKLEELNL